MHELSPPSHPLNAGKSGMGTTVCVCVEGGRGCCLSLEICKAKGEQATLNVRLRRTASLFSAQEKIRMVNATQIGEIVD